MANDEIKWPAITGARGFRQAERVKVDESFWRCRARVGHNLVNTNQAQGKAGELLEAAKVDEDEMVIDSSDEECEIWGMSTRQDLRVMQIDENSSTSMRRRTQ